MRISSSITLILKFFIPLFWGVIFCSFTAVLWLMENDHYLFGQQSFKIGTTIAVASGMIIAYFTLFSLKRVEADLKGYFITNYFKTYHFPFEMIASQKRIKLLLGIELIIFKFIHKTSFGHSIFFITTRKRYTEYLNEIAISDSNNEQ